VELHVGDVLVVEAGSGRETINLIFFTRFSTASTTQPICARRRTSTLVSYLLVGEVYRTLATTLVVRYAKAT
jgi:hypothetical protein